MENKLYRAAAALPEPETSFGTLLDKVEMPKLRRPWKKTAVVLAVVLALLLCGMGWVKTNLSYGMWTLYTSPDWRDAKWAAERFDIQLPETMDGVPFDEYWVCGHVPQGGSWLRAYLSPLYLPRSVYYTVRETGDITLPDGSTTSYTYSTEDFKLSFGTTENELWRYYFQFDENDIWTGWEVPGSYDTIEYKGITLQIGDTTYYSALEDRDVCTRWVHWIDEERHVAFSVSEKDYLDPDRVVECAKLIIDLNS